MARSDVTITVHCDSRLAIRGIRRLQRALIRHNRMTRRDWGGAFWRAWYFLTLRG